MKWTKAAVVTAVCVAAVTSSIDARTVTRDYVERKVCGDDLSSEACRASVLLELRRRFAEEAVGAYVQSRAASSLGNVSESVQQEIRSQTLARAQMEILNDADMHQGFFDSGGLLTVHARMCIDEGSVARFRERLDRESGMFELSSATPHSTRTRSPSLSTAEDDDLRHVCVYAIVGPTKRITSPDKSSGIGTVGLEYMERHLALDAFVTYAGDQEAGRDSPGVYLMSWSLGAKMMPASTRAFTFAVGGAVGVSQLYESRLGNEYESVGKHALGMAETTLLPGRVRLRARATYIRTWFASPQDAPTLAERPHVGSGLQWTLGMAGQF